MSCRILKDLTRVVDLFGQLSDASNHLSRKVMGVFLHDVMQVRTESVLLRHLMLCINIALSTSQGFPCLLFSAAILLKHFLVLQVLVLVISQPCV